MNEKGGNIQTMSLICQVEEMSSVLLWLLAIQCVKKCWFISL